MEKSTQLDYQNREANYLEIVELIEKSNHSAIVINSIILNDLILEELELKFEDKLICYIAWSKTLIVEESISTDFVKSNLNLFLQCFIEFDSKAHEMMDLIATTFEIDLDDSSQIWDLKRNKSKNQRGQINSSWSYHFHGAECSFQNHKTGQFLDIKIIYGREYGVIDNFFLYKFIQTTKSLQNQFKLLNGTSHNLRKVTSVLYREGYLIRKPNHNFGELILNRNTKIYENR